MDLVRNPSLELKTIPDILRLQAVDQPETVAVIDQENTLTYREFADRVLYLATKIAIHRPSVIALLIPRSSAYLITYFAGLSVGATLVPLDSSSTAPEINLTLGFCKVDLLIYLEDKAELIAKVKAESASVIMMEFRPQDCIPKVPWSKDLVLDLWPKDPDNVALLLHTSGSLAKPKRVMLTHGGLISNASAHALHMELTAEDRVLIVLPMHFGYCNTAQILTHLLLGGVLIILSGTFAPHRCLRLIDENKITTLTAVPTMLMQIEAFEHRKKYVAASLRQVSFGGAPFPLERLGQLILEYPAAAFCQTYGQTEAGPRITGVRPCDASKWPQSVGTPIPGVDVRLLKKNGDPATDGETGEIVVKGSGLMKGYLGAPDETELVLRDGWLFTGDLGQRGVDGEYYVVGRLKNFIIRGGINVYPEEIELVLLQHPAVAAVLVQGIGHPVLGEVPHASIVLNEHRPVGINELRDFARTKLTPYKMPEIELVDELPRTYNGKILRTGALRR